MGRAPLAHALWLFTLSPACGPAFTWEHPDGAPETVDGYVVTGADGGACAEVSVTVTSVIPTVLLVVDRSGSMAEDFPGATNRWEAVYSTLMASNGIVTSLQNDVRFGLALYTRGSGTCPDLRQVSPSMANFGAIDTVYGPADPGDDTPTGESIQAVTPALAAYPEPGPKAIVLATDGLPDTCANSDTNDAARQVAVSAVQAAYTQGIETHVVSVGPDVAQAHLQDLANAGKGLPLGGGSNAPYYQALDASALVAAFQNIIGGVRTCTFSLDGVVADHAADEGKVYLDGTVLPESQWRLVDPSTIELMGAACTTLMGGGDHTVSATFPCDGFTVN